MAERYQHNFKVILVGDRTVGKSSLLAQYLKKVFSEHYQNTVGVDYIYTDMNIEEIKIRLELWDTQGEERFPHISAPFYKGANGVMIVYDISNLDSFLSVKRWKDVCDTYLPSNIPKLIVGNKSDKEERAVDTETGLELAHSLGMEFIETSAKKATNVKVAFETMAKIILRKLNSKPTILIHQPAKPAAEVKFQARYCCS